MLRKKKIMLIIFIKIRLNEILFIKEYKIYLLVTKNFIKNQINLINVYTKQIFYDNIDLFDENALCVRNKRDGDRVFIKDLGFKKLKNLFVERKIPISQRGRLPVLAIGDFVLMPLDKRLSHNYGHRDGLLLMVHIWEENNEQHKCFY